MKYTRHVRDSLLEREESAKTIEILDGWVKEYRNTEVYFMPPDSECIYEEGDYTEYFSQLFAGSTFFESVNVTEESWSIVGDGDIKICMKLQNGKKKFRKTFYQDSDDIQDEFFLLMGKILEHKHLCLIQSPMEEVLISTRQIAVDFDSLLGMDLLSADLKHLVPDAPDPLWRQFMDYILGFESNFVKTPDTIEPARTAIAAAIAGGIVNAQMKRGFKVEEVQKRKELLENAKSLEDLPEDMLQEVFADVICLRSDESKRPFWLNDKAPDGRTISVIVESIGDPVLLDLFRRLEELPD